MARKGWKAPTKTLLDVEMALKSAGLTQVANPYHRRIKLALNRIKYHDEHTFQKASPITELSKGYIWCGKSIVSAPAKYDYEDVIFAMIVSDYLDDLLKLILNYKKILGL